MSNGESEQEDLREQKVEKNHHGSKIDIFYKVNNVFKCAGLENDIQLVVVDNEEKQEGEHNLVGFSVNNKCFACVEANIVDVASYWFNNRIF